MTRRELIEKVYERIEKNKLTRSQVEEIVKTFLEVIEEEYLKGEDSFSLWPLGKLVAVVKKPRKGRNPKTGEVVNIPARRTLKFKPAKHLIQQVED